MVSPAVAERSAALTDTQRTNQLRNAAIIALAVRTYYRTRVNVRDPASVEAWLTLVLPRIMSSYAQNANETTVYANLIRAIEIPGVKDGFAFDKSWATTPPAAVRTSLAVVGPTTLVKQLDKIRELDKEPAVARALQSAAIDSSAKAVGGATLKHILNAGREIVNTGVKADEKSYGYIRVTSDDPCYFCAMLASRGIVYGPYNGESFKQSDARFIGEQSNVKVHDHCECSTKPVYHLDDPDLERSKAYRDIWDGMSHRGGAADIKQFRQIYENRVPEAA